MQERREEGLISKLGRAPIPCTARETGLCYKQMDAHDRNVPWAPLNLNISHY
jgi:hypothetical protein